VLVIVKTYPLLNKKHDKLVCVAGIDLETKSWIRIFPIRFFKLPKSQRFAKFDIIELEVEPTLDPRRRKESYKAKDTTIKIVGKIDTENNWAKRKQILEPLLQKSVEHLKEQNAKDKTSLGIIKPKTPIVFKIESTSAYRPWEKALVTGSQLTIDGEPYESPLEKIPYRFAYVFKCNDPNCNSTHDLMIEDWELCRLYLRCKEKVNDEKIACSKVREKYGDKFLAENDVSLVLGTEINYGKWLIIGVFYPKKQSQKTLF